MLGSNSTHDDAVAALKLPDINPADLAVIAGRFPDLRPAVAAHPAAYPELLDWLTATGDTTLALIVGNRPRAAATPEEATQAPTAVPPAAPRTPASPGARQSVADKQPSVPSEDADSPAATARRSGVQPIVIVLAVAVVIVAAALIVLLLWMNRGDDPGTDPTTATNGGSSTQPTAITKPSDAWVTNADGIVQPDALEGSELWAVVNTYDVPLYRGPGTTYQWVVYAALPDVAVMPGEGWPVKIVGSMAGNTDFKYVSVMSGSGVSESLSTQYYGWLETKALAMPEKEIIWPEVRVGYGKHATVDPKAGLNLRTGPGTSYDVLLTIPQNAGVEEVGYTTAALNNGWTFIRYEFTEGWAATDYLTFIQGGMAKPVIYLYPEQPTQVSVAVTLPAGWFTQTIPDYGDGWNVTAYPDGTLVNAVDGQSYPYLFWEAAAYVNWDVSSGWVVAGADTAIFLSDKLAYLGMNPQEIADFLEYWQPRLEANPYNLITFQTDAYESAARLAIAPQPDSVLRVFMAYAPLDAPVSLPPQQLTSWQRKGFAAVEWGGGEIPSPDLARVGVR
jgi:uncharacterized protein YraI